MIGLDRLLRDIGKNRIGPTEGHHGHLGEEQPDGAVNGVKSKHHTDDGERRDPQRQPGGKKLKRAAPA
ncbi:hypothetical protein D3C72_2461230 [compost metagenome]